MEELYEREAKEINKEYRASLQTHATLFAQGNISNEEYEARKEATESIKNARFDLLEDLILST